MVIISALDKIFELCKKYVNHKDHCQISIKKIMVLSFDLKTYLAEAFKVWGPDCGLICVVSPNFFSTGIF